MRLIIITFCALVLSACASLGDSFPTFSKPDVVEHSSFQHASFKPSDPSQPVAALDYYSAQLVEEISATMRSADSAGIIALTQFADANSNYESIDELGFALNELMLRDLHRAGFRTVDFKVTDAVRVTHKGDFALSRDFMELKHQVQADYVLVGTLINSDNGVIVNARVVDLQSKNVLATGKSMIPRSVVAKLSMYHPSMAMH